MDDPGRLDAPLLPLAELMVLDLSTGIAGGYATKLLADAGARVLKVEPPGGDPLRRRAAGRRPGLLFEFLSSSKHLDGTVDDEALAARLGDVDVVVESSGPGAMEARGLDFAALQAANPRASLVSISPFGRFGPWSGRPATEFTLQAQAGGTATRGLPGRPYLNAGGAVGEWMAGTATALAALAAWHRAERCGIGDHVDVSMLEAITPTCTNVQSVWGSFSGDYEQEPRLEIPSIERTSDGWVGFCVFTGQQWRDFCVLIGHAHLAEDPELATMGGRIANGARLRPLIEGYTRARTTEEVVADAVLLRIPVAPVGNGATIPTFEQFVARRVYSAHPAGFLAPRVPYRLDGPARPTGPPPAGSRADLGPVDPGGWPLQGVRVIDLTAFWAGPYATFTLACLGADVLHIESVQRPDGMRFGSVRPPGSDHWWEFGPTFHASNANKRSVTLDLARPAGREALRRLVEVSDILVENFSPRVLDQLGCPWEVLREWNPRLVLVRMPAFGLDGPWRDRVGFAQTMEHVSGMAWLTGYADTEPMNARGPSDPLAGTHAAFAALVGLAVRQRTGAGVHIEATMVETALNAAAEQVIEHSATGTLLTRDGNHHPGEGPQGIFRCADRPPGTMGAVAVAAPDPEHLRSLGTVVGEAVPADPDGFDAVLERWCSTRPLAATVGALLAAGIPAAPVVGARHGDDNPQHRARGFYEAVEHAVAGTHRLAAFPAVFGRQPDRRFRRAAPMLGEHTREVLAELAGYGDEELDALEAERVIGTQPLHA